MKNKTLMPKILIVIGAILLVFNIQELDFNNLKFSSFFGIISNLLLILAMVVTIRELKKDV